MIAHGKISIIILNSTLIGFVDTEIFDKSDAGRRLKASWIGKMMMKMAETPLQGAQTTLGRKFLKVVEKIVKLWSN